MSGFSTVVCDGCGDEVSDVLLSPAEMRDSLQMERGWVVVLNHGSYLDVCPKPECEEACGQLAGFR